MHQSEQYSEYVRACHDLAVSTADTREEASIVAEQKASAYLRVASKTLYPRKKFLTDEAITMTARALSSPLVVSLFLLWTRGDAEAARRFAQGIEVAGRQIVTKAREKLVLERSPRLHTLRRDESITIYRPPESRNR